MSFWEPQELPPLPDGAERHLFSRDELLAFVDSNEALLDTHELTVRLAMDGRWAVDVVKAETQLQPD